MGVSLPTRVSAEFSHPGDRSEGHELKKEANNWQEPDHTSGQTFTNLVPTSFVLCGPHRKGLISPLIHGRLQQWEEEEERCWERQLGEWETVLQCVGGFKEPLLFLKIYRVLLPAGVNAQLLPLGATPCIQGSMMTLVCFSQHLPSLMSLLSIPCLISTAFQLVSLSPATALSKLSSCYY